MSVAGVVDDVHDDNNDALRVKSVESESPAFEHFLYEELNDVVIVGTYSAGDYELTLQAGHNYVNPAAPNADYLNIAYEGNPGVITDFVNNRFSQHKVTNVATNVITISPPLAYDFDPVNVEKSKRVNVNLSKTAALPGTKIKFFATPTNGLVWNTRRLMVDMILNGAPDDALFGNLAQIPNGVYFGFESPVSLFREYNVSVFDNAGFRATAYDVAYTTRSGGGGNWGLSMRKTFAGVGQYGSVIRLDGSLSDQFVAYVQDDLTLIPRFRVKIMGNIQL